MVRHQRGSCDLFHTNTAADLLEALRKRKGPTVLFFDFPDSVIANQLVRSSIPKISIWDDFQDVVAHCSAAWNMDLRSAIRHAAHAANCLSPIISAPGIRSLRIDPTSSTFAGCMNQMARTLGLQLGQREIDVMAKSYGVANAKSGEQFEALFGRLVGQSSMHGLSAADAELLAQVSEAYAAHLNAPGARALIWPAGLFQEGIPPFRPATALMDLTGPARILFFGPYINLPEGFWVAEVRFRVAGNRSGNSLRFEVAASNEVVASSRIVLPLQGAFSTRIAFESTRADVPFEIRAILMEGAIEGDFQLVDVALHRASSISMENH